MSQIPYEQGLIVFPESAKEEPRLQGSRCNDCGAAFHPAKPLCLSCYSRNVKEVALSGHGTLFAFTQTQMKLRPGMREGRGFWIGNIDLDEGLRVQAVLAPDIGEPEIGMRVSLGLETVKVEENGDEVVIYHFGAEGA